MATDLISDIWPEGLQRAIGQVVLISALVDTLASVFSDEQGLSGKRLKEALEACPESDLRAIGTDYYALYQQRNDLVHGFCVMPDGMNLISNRMRGNIRVRAKYSVHEIDALVNGFSDLLQRVKQAQDRHPKYTTIKEAPTP